MRGSYRLRLCDSPLSAKRCTQSSADAWGSRLNHHLADIAADIEFEIEALHRRARIVPNHATGRCTAAHELFGDHPMHFEHRVKLSHGDIRPGETKRGHPPFHRTQHEAP